MIEGDIQLHGPIHFKLQSSFWLKAMPAQFKKALAIG